MIRTGLRTLVWVLASLTLAGCVPFESYRIKQTEERLVADCAFIDQITAVSDMGPFQIHPILMDDARGKILRRAENMNATHVVWLGDYYFGGAAMAYYCYE